MHTMFELCRASAIPSQRRLFGKKKDPTPVPPPPTLEETIKRSDERTSSLDTKVRIFP